MADNVKTTGYPPLFLNAYINAQLERFGLIAESQTMLPPPFIPASVPTNIEDLYNDQIQIRGTEKPILIMYDRLTRFRPTPFYRHKREQLIYFIYTAQDETLLNIMRVITEALAREDAAAQDINSWLKSNPLAYAPTNVFFHNVRVYQADESRDVVELASAKTLFVNKIIIEYDYHTNDTITIGSTSYTNIYT